MGRQAGRRHLRLGLMLGHVRHELSLAVGALLLVEGEVQLALAKLLALRQVLRDDHAGHVDLQLLLCFRPLNVPAFRLALACLDHRLAADELAAEVRRVWRHV